MNNCPNCGAPINPYKCQCEYCGITVKEQTEIINDKTTQYELIIMKKQLLYELYQLQNSHNELIYNINFQDALCKLRDDIKIKCGICKGEVI